jgi:Na+/H+ antiporter NhaD/arsenite permease-like protein
MAILIIVVFVLGYAAIAFEHPLKIDKAASALIAGMVCWAIYVFSLAGNPDAIEIVEYGKDFVSGSDHHPGGLYHHLFDIANILFFLMGAMTIVELVDAHEGFAVITDRIKTTDKTKLLWIICILTFFFSAALDNLTTTIVMISLLRKLVKDQKTRWMFVGMVVLSANAGGAWSPIGDVTTTMLWIKGQLPNVPSLITDLIIPSMVSMLVPLGILSFTFKGNVERPSTQETAGHYLNPTTSGERTLVFVMGLAGLIFVPIFKTATHLPPFMGMMLSLGVIWMVTELMHKGKSKEDKAPLSVISVLQKIDVASVLFFLGILLAVAALQEFGHLDTVAAGLVSVFGEDIFSINIVIGLLSAIVDNVPLVAAAQGMFDISTEAGHNYAANGPFWKFLAYCAGTGGSALIIGSAAGVAAMGLEKIDFMWYLKKISWLAIIGYFSGAIVYYLMFL